MMMKSYSCFNQLFHILRISNRLTSMKDLVMKAYLALSQITLMEV